METDDNKETERIYDWILSYTTYKALDNYIKNAEIGINRDFVQGVILSPHSCSDKTFMEISLLVLLCRLVDGHDHTFHYSGDDDDDSITPLEDALQRFKDFSERWGHFLHEENEVIVTIEQQAVITCCRAGDVQAGINVFNRLKPNFKTNSEMDLASLLEQMLRSKTMLHEMVNFHPYTELHERMAKCLKSLLNNLEVPFLIQATRQAVSKKSNSNDTQCETSKDHKRINTNIILTSLSDLKHDTSKTYLEGDEAVQFKGKLAHLRKSKDEYFAKVPEILCLSGVPEAGGSGLQLHATENHSSDGGSAPEGDDCSSPKPIRQRLNVDFSHRRVSRRRLGSVSAGGSPVRRLARKLPWTQREEATLYRAVLKWGVGNWARVASECRFVGRTNVHIKDKWRTMTKRKFVARLRHLRDLYGEIPNVKY